MTHVLKQPTTSLGLAYDVGMAYSGYSTCAAGGEPQCQQSWPGQDQPYCKTKTALLYKRSPLEVVAMGWEAHKQFVSLRKDQQQDYIYVTRFKLLLAGPEQSGSKPEHHLVEAGKVTFPQELTPKKLITDLLRHLSQHAFSKLQAQYGSFQKDDVTVVLSVPAAWSDFAKQVMRQAAIDAGLVSNPKLLQLVHEPEAAALAVLKEPQAQVALTEGDVFVNLDAGGGTVDITCHKVERKDGQLRLTEETYREGVMAGSTFINTGIEQAVRERLTPAVYDAWKEKNPVDAVKLIHDRAEQQKRSFDGSAPITLEMPNSLFKVITEETCQKLRAEQAGNDEELVISKEAACAIFDKVLEQIIEATKKLLARTKGGCDYMLLVGGFAESPYLVKRIREAFSSSVRRKIVRPDVPSQAVLKGGALYALSPEVITGRRSRLAYGVECVASFRSGHREELRITAGSRTDLCSKLFKSMVKMDELVEHDQVKTASFTAVAKHQTMVQINLYTCTNNSDRYVDAEAMRKLGELTLHIADPSKIVDPEAYTLTVSFLLGGSELGVTAVDDQTKEEVKTTIMFVAE